MASRGPSLTDIPDELVEYIFTCLPTKYTLRARQVCRDWSVLFQLPSVFLSERGFTHLRKTHQQLLSFHPSTGHLVVGKRGNDRVVDNDPTVLSVIPKNPLYVGPDKAKLSDQLRRLFSSTRRLVLRKPETFELEPEFLHDCIMHGTARIDSVDFGYAYYAVQLFAFIVGNTRLASHLREVDVNTYVPYRFKDTQVMCFTDKLKQAWEGLAASATIENLRVKFDLDGCVEFRQEFVRLFEFGTNIPLFRNIKRLGLLCLHPTYLGIVLTRITPADATSVVEMPHLISVELQWFGGLVEVEAIAVKFLRCREQRGAGLMTIILHSSYNSRDDYGTEPKELFVACLEHVTCKRLEFCNGEPFHLAKAVIRSNPALMGRQVKTVYINCCNQITSCSYALYFLDPKNFSHLRKFKFSCEVSGDELAQQLCRAIKKHPTLVKLYADFCCFDGTHVSLIEAICANPRLEVLDLMFGEDSTRQTKCLLQTLVDGRAAAGLRRLRLNRLQFSKAVQRQAEKVRRVRPDVLVYS